MTFGDAIDAMTRGERVTREGWNCRGMWIVLMHIVMHIGYDTPSDSKPYFAMWTAAEQWQPGWLASQADILADDWMVVE